MFSLLIAALFAVSVCSARRNDYSAAALGDAITTLPGLDATTFKKYSMFSGYIDVYPQHNRNIFYWFIESLNAPTTDPIAVWTNGGPGASGLIGMFTEHGPFRPLQNLTLRVQPWSWVNVANMIYIEAPSGVGFSYSDNSNDYYTNDNQTAIDNYHFIQGWLTKFPNYMANDFYITSESYGGHYMPTLAQQIILGNAAGGNPQINFAGVFDGNPYTNHNENQRGEYETYGGHQMTSRPVFSQWTSACKDGDSSSNACTTARNAMRSDVGNNIDPYAIDWPVCKEHSKYNEIYLFYKYQYESGADNIRPPGIYGRMFDYFKEYPGREIYVDGKNVRGDNDIIITTDGFPYDPCEENYMSSYLNEAAVQTAIHVKAKHWPGTQIHYGGGLPDMTVVWKWVIANTPKPLHLTIVSGDDDTVCGLAGTQSWMWDMGWTVDSRHNWVVWTDTNQQTGGYLVKWQNAMNLVTVHSAGHMIPECQPSRSLQAFTRYLSGEF
jgi:carboxypeptidase C (cathepsin A)